MIGGSTLRIVLRTLARHRGFTAVAALSIAVAVALNTTMYSALDKLIDPQINARNPERIYTIRRSVLQPSPESVCVIRVDGTRSGQC